MKKPSDQQPSDSNNLRSHFDQEDIDFLEKLLETNGFDTDISSSYDLVSKDEDLSRESTSRRVDRTIQPLRDLFENFRNTYNEIVPEEQLKYDGENRIFERKYPWVVYGKERGILYFRSSILGNGDYHNISITRYSETGAPEVSYYEGEGYEGLSIFHQNIVYSFSPEEQKQIKWAFINTTIRLAVEEGVSPYSDEYGLRRPVGIAYITKDGQKAWHIIYRGARDNDNSSEDDIIGDAFDIDSLTDEDQQVIFGAVKSNIKKLTIPRREHSVVTAVKSILPKQLRS